MKEKDITQKVLEDNNDIFADIVNVLLFDGESEELIPRGRTKLQTGDVIVTMTDDRDGVMVQEQMEKLCREMF